LNSPDHWSDEKIFAAIRVASEPPAAGIRVRDAATSHFLTHEGVVIYVIKDNGKITSGFPTGGNQNLLDGFKPL